MGFFMVPPKRHKQLEPLRITTLKFLKLLCNKMKNLGASSEVSSFGKELDFMAWFIPGLHGRQTVLFHQRGASPTACLYGFKGKLRPAQVAWAGRIPKGCDQPRSLSDTNLFTQTDGLTGRGGRGTIQRHMRRIQINTYNCQPQRG
jgi:hypothetical protein